MARHKRAHGTPAKREREALRRLKRGTEQAEAREARQRRTAERLREASAPD
jgi:hypothetical protein